MRYLILISTFLIGGCVGKKIDPSSEECKCKIGSYFPETGKCEAVFYFHEPCLFQPEDYVCGCDGMNYPNVCFQNRAGVKLSTKGMCPN